MKLTEEKIEDSELDRIIFEKDMEFFVDEFEKILERDANERIN